MAGSPADAFARHAWGEVHLILSRAPRGDLDEADLERLAVAAYLTGKDDDAVGAWQELHGRHLGAGQRADAARDAFWAAFCLMMQGQMGHAGGWLGRCEAAIGDDLDCVARGYLLVPAILQALDSDEARRARDLAVQAGEIAQRFSDPELAAFSTLGHGQAVLAMGEADRGVALLDEVMLLVTDGDVGPVVSGIVYCAVILECMQLYDLARAAEWTAVLDEWCREQPDLVPYRGQCLVHQSQLRQAAGDWDRAVSAAVEARHRLSDPPHPALGLAFYQEGELHRLQGELDEAADAYKRASRAGYEPMPGLALLELERGATAAAASGIRRALGEASQPFRRPGLLAAAVEIHVGAGDAALAAEAAADLVALAERSSSPVLAAMAAQATGAALLCAGEAADAMVHLRSAGAAWQRLAMPYEAASCAVLRGESCRASGDATSAALEFDNAIEIFESLGAELRAQRVRRLAGGSPPGGVLSGRELEVLSLVADGRSSRDIAEALSISRHTVRRHLENTFAKLGVNSRAAAVAYAYEHDLL